MADPRWQFDRSAHRYRDTTTGRFLPNKTVTDIRDRVVDTATKEVRTLAEQAVRGEISPETFRLGMRESIKRAHVANYTFGRGGVAAMTPADFGRVGRSLRDQYAYLNGFETAIANGTLSEAQAAARAQQYINGATYAYEMGNSASWGIEAELPGHPADGGTQCGSSCRCSWDISETETEVIARWQTDSDPCPDCSLRASRWARIAIPKVMVPVAVDPVRLQTTERALRGRRVA